MPVGAMSSSPLARAAERRACSSSATSSSWASAVSHRSPPSPSPTPLQRRCASACAARCSRVTTLPATALTWTRPSSARSIHCAVSSCGSTPWSRASTPPLGSSPMTSPSPSSSPPASTPLRRQPARTITEPWRYMRSACSRSPASYPSWLRGGMRLVPRTVRCREPRRQNGPRASRPC